jgi:hypothetical protein
MRIGIERITKFRMGNRFYMEIQKLILKNLLKLNIWSIFLSDYFFQ